MVSTKRSDEASKTVGARLGEGRERVEAWMAGGGAVIVTVSVLALVGFVVAALLFRL